MFFVIKHLRYLTVTRVQRGERKRFTATWRRRGSTNHRAGITANHVSAKRLKILQMQPAFYKNHETKIIVNILNIYIYIYL